MTKIYRAAIMAWLIIVFFSGVAAAQYQNGIPVLLYHHVNNNHIHMPTLTVSVREFDRQMGALEAAGFHTISLDSLIAYMKGEQVDLPDKPIIITFDDGYEDNYSTAFPILKKHGFKAAVFVVGLNFDKRGHMSSQQAQEMIAAGFTIGAHSMTHQNLTIFSGDQLTYEVAGSKHKAEQATHTKVKYFAYPGGFYDLSTLNAVRDAGYAAAFTVLPGLNSPGLDNVYLLRRIPIFSFTNFDRLLAMLNANHPKQKLLEYDVPMPGSESERYPER